MVKRHRYQEFSDGLKRLRRRMNLTQEQMSRMMDLTTSATQKLEQGVNLPDAVTLIKILTLLGEHGGAVLLSLGMSPEAMAKLSTGFLESWKHRKR